MERRTKSSETDDTRSEHTPNHANGVGATYFLFGARKELYPPICRDNCMV